MYIAPMNPIQTPTTDRLRKLLIKQEFEIGNLNPVDRTIVMVTAALAIPGGQTFTEKEVTERLYRWVATIGSNVHADAVEMRRYLIDNRCLNRDRAGSSYTRAAWPSEWKEIAAELEQIDIDSFADRVRTEEIERRAARKKAALENERFLSS